MLRKFLDQLLDAIERRLTRRANSPTARMLKALGEAHDRQIILARGAAREAMANELLDPKMADATKAAMDRLASRYAIEVHNIAVTIFEEHFVNTPTNVRYGHFNRNAFPARQGAIQISIGRFEEHIPLSKLDKEH